jgi:hypothetical protein
MLRDASLRDAPQHEAELGGPARPRRRRLSNLRYAAPLTASGVLPKNCLISPAGRARLNR